MASSPCPSPHTPARSLSLQGFHLSETEFETIRQVARDTAGIVLADSKRDMVASRLSRRLRTLGCPDFASYLSRLSGGGGAEEVIELLNSITTNVTAFFREAHHFNDLSALLRAQLDAGKRRFRFWSAGCATGEEPYSIAAIAHDAFKDAPFVDWRILATDIDTNALNTARAGRYAAAALNDIDPAHHALFSADDAHIEARPALRDRIAFKRLNLIEPWRINGPLDAVFCRNVTIYFSQATKVDIHRRMAALLSPHGRFYIGHAETADARALNLALAGRTTYAPAVKETRP